jgi:hypothetical protein
MELGWHVFWIFLIVVVACAVYAAFFTKNYVRKMWESSRYIPFLPEKLDDFVPVFKTMLVVTLVALITMYILLATGVIAD